MTAVARAAAIRFTKGAEIYEPRSEVDRYQRRFISASLAGTVWGLDIPEWPGTSDFWAPDIVFLDGQYHLYYSASGFGGNQSCIGHATRASLAFGSWQDRGALSTTPIPAPITGTSYASPSWSGTTTAGPSLSVPDRKILTPLALGDVPFEEEPRQTRGEGIASKGAAAGSRRAPPRT